MVAASESRVIDFPALFVAHDWAQQHCVIPDGFDKGKPWVFYDWQAWCLLNFYRVRPDAKFGQLAPAFHFRRGQVVLPQKAGKAPYTSAHVCIEAVGPALFGGWAKGGEIWDCRDHGCGCGWVYEYGEGEAMGLKWPTPLIQITAFSEEQTDNIYDALRPMIEGGPLSDLIPKTGEEFIRLPNRGRIDIVTSSARSRLGQRVTFVPQDETGIWTPDSGMVKVAETQRRGLAGMGGRAEETTNGWDPSEGSVAQRTAESSMEDVFRFHPLAPTKLSYKNKAERRKIHRYVYRDCKHVDLDAIEAEARELLVTDPHQAERFFGNRIVAGGDKAFDVEVFKKRANGGEIEPGRMVTAGFDGSRRLDSTGIVLTDVETGHQFVHSVWERPAGAPEDWEVPILEVNDAVADVFERWDVWRFYGDPPYFETEMDTWAGLYGEKRVVKWYTNQYKRMAYAIKAWMTDWTAKDTAYSHDGNDALLDHVGNAIRRQTKMRDDDGSFLWVMAKDGANSPRKIDLAMCAVLSWAARGDAIESGALNRRKFKTASW